MSPIVIVVLVIYLVAVFLIGLWAGGKSKNMTDFLLAGRKLTLWVAVMTISASWFGGGLLIGMGQKTWTSGYIMYFYPLNALFGLVFAGLLIKKMRGFTKFSTVTEYLESRYNSKLLRTLCSLLSLVALIGLIGSQVTAVVSVLTNFGAANPTVIAIIATIVLIIYTSIGGFLAVTVTDCVQIILVILGIIAATIISVNHVGGLGTLFSTLNSQAASLPDGFTKWFGTSDQGISYILYMIIPPIMYALIGQDLYQRLFACNSLKTARRASIISGILVFCLVLFPATMGLVAKVLYPDLANGAQSIPTLIINFLPPLAAGIVLAAILAAIMSTADSLMSAATSHFMNDIYTQYIDKSADINSKKLLNLSRAFTAIVGFAAMIVALVKYDIIALCIDSYTLYSSGVFAPIILGVLWKKATKEGAFTGLAFGVILSIMGIAGVSYGKIPTVVMAGGASVISMVIVSLLTYKGEKTKEETTPAEVA